MLRDIRLSVIRLLAGAADTRPLARPSTGDEPSYVDQILAVAGSVRDGGTTPAAASAGAGATVDSDE